jgi:DNA-directed RNA polymerase specialized sigma24 family protein
MSGIPTSDRECLLSWKRGRDPAALRHLIASYAPFVHAAAMRRAGDERLALEIARGVLLVFARRAHRLPKRTVLASWLFEITRLACRKSLPRRWWPWRWFRRSPDRESSMRSSWQRVAPHLDRMLHRMPKRQREAVLLRSLVGIELAECAGILRTRERRVQKRHARGLRSLARRMRKHSGGLDAEALGALLCSETSRTSLPESIIAEAIENGANHPRLRLARRVLNSLALKRWCRRIIVGYAAVTVLLCAIAGAGFYIDSKSGFSRSLAIFVEWTTRYQAQRIPGLAARAKPWPSDNAAPRLDAIRVRSSDQLYRSTNIWLAHLMFSCDAWEALQPKRVRPVAHFFQPDDTVLLRNPAAKRHGVAGSLGFDFDWTYADLEFGGAVFTNAAARLKGNGTFLSSLYGGKRAFKVDLNKFVKGQKLAGVDELTFNNLVVDQSFMSDALAYEFFRDAGVPAPRTAYAYLSLTVAGEYERKPLGLYALIEAVDSDFAKMHFGSTEILFLKPVTYNLFEFLGEEWPPYADIYDLKAEATPQEKQRVVDFARLVSQASDTEFSARLGEFLDLEAFAKFLAAQVLLANYDSILVNGQNFYAYLDPRTGKFGFIPWDLDLAWGGFFLLGSAEERERASIWHPWAGKNRFIERVMKVEEFRKLYRQRLEKQLATLFTRERLFPRIDQLAATIRPAVAAESNFRLGRFEQAVGGDWPEQLPRGGSKGADRPIHYLKRFIEKRAYFVRQQLDGKSHGMVLRW